MITSLKNKIYKLYAWICWLPYRNQVKQALTKAKLDHEAKVIRNQVVDIRKAKQVKVEVEKYNKPIIETEEDWQKLVREANNEKDSN